VRCRQMAGMAGALTGAWLGSRRPLQTKGMCMRMGLGHHGHVHADQLDDSNIHTAPTINLSFPSGILQCLG
jgi:hypothetical protein